MDTDDPTTPYASLTLPNDEFEHESDSRKGFRGVRVLELPQGDFAPPAPPSCVVSVPDTVRSQATQQEADEAEYIAQRLADCRLSQHSEPTGDNLASLGCTKAGAGHVAQDLCRDLCPRPASHAPAAASHDASSGLLVLQDGKVPQNQHSCALANYLTQLVLRLCAVLFQQGSARVGAGDFASLQAIYRQLQALCTPTATTSSLIDSGGDERMHEDDESVPCLWVFKGTSVWHMAEGGEMSGGTLQLGGGGVVALDRSCTDFHLSDVYLNGGVLVCHGETCNVTLTNTHFSECSLVVLGGAQVSLHACTFTRTTTAAPHSAAIYVHGAGSRADVRGGADVKRTIEGGAHGVVVQAGAAVRVESVGVSGLAVSGVLVEGEGSTIGLSNSYFKDFSTAFSKTTDATAVLVRAGGAAALEVVCMTGMHVGVHACCDAHVNLQRCHLKGTKRSAVVIESRSRGVLNHCELAEAGGDAVQVSGRGTSCDMHACKLLRNALSGAVVTNRGNMMLRDCASEGNRQLGGYVAQHGATMTLERCTSTRDFRGCFVKNASMVCEEACMSHSVRQLVKADSAADVALVRCKLTDAHAAPGVAARMKGTVLTMHECFVADTRESCVHVVGGARARVSGCALCLSKQASGLSVRDSGSAAAVAKCVFARNRCVGACASPGAQVTVRDSGKWGNGASADVRPYVVPMYECPGEYTDDKELALTCIPHLSDLVTEHLTKAGRQLNQST